MSVIQPVADLRSRQAGSLSAAWAQRAFRWVFLGNFASNIGTWMQNFTLGALADQMTGKAAFIGLVTFAQLGPTLLLSPWAGVLADQLDRRRTMIGCALVQTGLSVALAAVATGSRPSEMALVALVFAIGVAGALNAPAAGAALPALVGRRDLPGAISLNSAQMNASRVIGPLLAGLVVDLDHPGRIFLINAATYLFVISALALVRFDSRPPGRGQGETAWRRFAGGLVAARDDLVIRRILVTVSVYSLCSLVFIYQLHPFAIRVLGGGQRTFTLVFASFGLGAALGAIAVGTLLRHLDRGRSIRVALVGFAVALGALALSRSPGPAYVAAFVTGWCYFVVITNLSTILQQQVHDEVRGRVMGLWMMGWAGLVPLGSLVGGPVIDRVGQTPVFLFGAAVAALLAWYCRLGAQRSSPDPVVEPVT